MSQFTFSSNPEPCSGRVIRSAERRPRNKSTTMADDDEDYDALRAALLAPSTPDPFSPSRSFLEQSFFASLRSAATPSVMDEAANDPESEAAPRTIGHRWSAIVSRCHLWILLSLTVVWPMGAWSLHQLNGLTDSTVRPLPQTPSAMAQAAFARNYPSDYDNPLHPATVILLESRSNETLIDDTGGAGAEARDFWFTLNMTLSQHCWSWAENCTDDWLSLTSYYSLSDAGLSWLGEALVGDDGRLTWLELRYRVNGNSTKEDRARVGELRQVLEDYSSSYNASAFQVQFTGLWWFQADMVTQAKQDLRRMDVIVLPLALLLMGAVLPRARLSVLWMIPLASMLTTTAMWSMIMPWVARHWQITHFTPTIMMSLTIGMGIDYTMFLMARYLEADDGRSTSIDRMLTQSGHVLILSGLTLMCTFVGLCFLPLPMLQSIGIGAAVAIGSSLCVNLTVVPALLYTRLGDWVAVKRESSSEPSEILTTPESRPSSSPRPRSRSRSPERQPIRVAPSWWLRLSRHLMHPYRGIIILLITFQVLLPVAQYASQIKSSLSFDLLLPATSPALQTFYTMGRTVGWGRLQPYRILIDGHATNTSLTSSQGFDLLHRVVDELMAAEAERDGRPAGVTRVEKDRGHNLEVWTAQLDLGRDKKWRRPIDGHAVAHLHAKRTLYNGVAVLKNTRVPYSAFVSAKYCAQMEPHCPFEFLHVLDAIDKMATSTDTYATVITATLAVNPFSDEGIAWLESTRATIQRMNDTGLLAGVEVHVEGAAAIEYDALTAVYNAFPTMIGITTAVVFVLMGAFFRSFFLPLRSIVSIGLTLGFTFGLGVLVYQGGALDWTALRAVSSIGGEFCWLVPIMSFSLIVGLALDYDVFLVSRILEFRLAGYEHKTSIAAAVDATGGVITAAGVIMAFSFGSLLFSSSPVLCQWSFLITTAVLLDTFVVRMIVVPIVTSLAGRQCWWPREVPETRIVIAEFQGRQDDVSGLLRSLEALSEYEPIHASPGSP